MPRSPSDDEEYDSDSGSDISFTDVQLGLADGPLEVNDESNPLVSRIGGRAAWLPMTSPPPLEISICTKCSKTMQLLVQIFAPLVESPFDRCLLVWGCPRAGCQRTSSNSIKVVRTLKHNPRWAVKLEKQRQKREAREAKEKEREQQRKARQQQQERLSKINPFAANANVGGGGNLFGSGANPFAAPEPDAAPAEDSDNESDNDNDEASRLAEELEIKAALTSHPPESQWTSTAPYYPALYLNTIPEPSSAPTKLTPFQAQSLKPSQDYNQDELKAWGKEGYEKMMLDAIDDVFERFVKRVGVEGRQVVRYEFGGVPLPFHGRGRVYDTLWPERSKAEAVKLGQFTAAEGQRSFDSSCIPPCPICKASRTFEAQLMPNLINTLRPETINGDTDDDSPDLSSLSTQARTLHEIELALGRKLPSSDTSAPVLSTRTGLTWSTALIFVCSKDCCPPSGETWAEEWVCLQFEDE